MAKVILGSHINVAAGFGPWQGERILHELARHTLARRANAPWPDPPIDRARA